MPGTRWVNTAQEGRGTMGAFTILREIKSVFAIIFLFKPVVLWLCLLPRGLLMPRAPWNVTLQTICTHWGEELAQEGLFFHHETGQCEVELISMYTDVLSTKGKHISRHFHNLKFTSSVPKNIHNQTMERVSLSLGQIYCPWQPTWAL